MDEPLVEVHEKLVDEVVASLSEASEGSLSEDLKIDKHNLDDEIAHQPEQYAWWSTRADIAKSLLAGRQLDLKIYEAELDERLRKEAKAREEKLTEAQLANNIEKDRKWKDISADIIELQKQVSVLVSALFAMAQRAEMLKAIAPGAYYESRASTEVPVKRNPVRTPV